MKTTIIGLILTSILGTVAFHFYTQNQVLSYQITEKAQQIKDILNTHEVRIDMLEYEVVDSLAKECETKGVKEPENTVKYDPPRKPKNDEELLSFGAYQMKIPFVKYYVKKYEKRDISNLEAINIAMTKDRARELAKKVIFDVGAGNDWVNCERKLNIDAQVAVIKKLKTQ